LPAFDHLVVFVLCSIGVQLEEWARAVSESGFIRLFKLIRWWLSLVTSYFISNYKLRENRSKRYVIRTFGDPPLGVPLRH
jgi:hypothetical protein